MSDKPEVTARNWRVDPNDGIGRPEGISYTIRMPNGIEREVFLFMDESAVPDYRCMRFVQQGAEGDNFYTTPRKHRFTNEPITQAVMNAVQEFDESQDAKKKIEAEPTGRGTNPARIRQAATLIN
jgi:hypothetical protein